ncbi:Patatin-like protein 2, partial [Dichanthelium oligosanthes]
LKTEDCHGNTEEFLLIDGGVGASNQPNVTFCCVAFSCHWRSNQQILKENPYFFPIKPMDYGRFLVISLGKGSAKLEANYIVQKATSWGVLGWLLGSGSTPLVDIFTQANADMVDIHISDVFKGFHSEQNYLRIQDDTLQGTLSSVDVATKENMERRA